MTRTRTCDVAVIGCGMAGLAAGLRAAEQGLAVLLLEKAPRDERGGQTRYVESFRVPSTPSGLPDRGYHFSVPDYTPEDFFADIMAQTNGKADTERARQVVEAAGPTLTWLTDHGVDWDMDPPHVGYTAARTFVDGIDLVRTLVQALERAGGEVCYETRATELIQDAAGAVTGVRASTPEGTVRVDSEAVVIAGGGFEGDARKRTLYFGPGYEEMPVRGSPLNTGEPIEMAIEVGARPVGQWSGAHMSLIDGNAPVARGGANRIDGYQYGVVLNRDGKRFVDEGQDARAHTYAKFGREFFEQDGREVYLLVDAGLEEYLWPQGPSEPVIGETITDVLAELGCDHPEVGEETVRTYNNACPRNPDFDPETLDGNATAGLEPPKSNWAIPLKEAPFVGYPLTGGITFTFGGIETTLDGAVIDTSGNRIPGLFAAGNSVGGLFYDNYPGGTALTNAAVFGKLAAERIAEQVQ